MSSAVLVIVLVAIAAGVPCAFAYVDHFDADAVPLESHRSEGP